MSYVDTNILIYLLEGTPKLGRRAAEVLTDQQAAGEKLVSSALMITEFVAGSVDKNALKVLMAVNNIAYVDITKDIASLAGSLQQKHALKIGDAIHLATCISQKCTVFITNDRKLGVIAAGYATVVSL